MLTRISLVLLLASFWTRSRGQRVDPASWPDQAVLSDGLCRYGNGVECCWGWSQADPRGRCQPHCQHGCKHGECVGPDRCKCHPGYAGKACNQDLNECGVKPRPCKHRCMNTPGSYKCYCLDGYTLQPDGSCRNARTCYHANCQYGCEVAKGEVRCTCPSPGLRLGPDRRTCIDIDECASGGGVCPRRRKCVNTFGSFVCKCHLGLKLAYINGRYTCVDKDTRPFCSLNPASPKCRCERGGCEAVLKATVEPQRPRTTRTTTPITTAAAAPPLTTTTPVTTTTAVSTTTTTTTPVSTTTTPGTTTTTTPVTTTAVTTTTTTTTTTTLVSTTTTTTPVTTTPVTTTTTTPVTTTTTTTTTTPVTTTSTTPTTTTTTTPVTTTTTTTTTTPVTTTSTTPTTTTTTTPVTTTTTTTTTTPVTTTSTTPTTTTTATSTAPGTATTASTTARWTSTSLPAPPDLDTPTTAATATTMAATSSLVTTTVSNRIEKEVTRRQRGDVHIPRRPGHSPVWEFDIELGNTAADAGGDPEAAELRCTFDRGLCDWMSDSEGDLRWEAARSPAGERYLSVPELKAGQRSVRGARLAVQVAPPWSRGGELCFSFSHWLTGRQVGVLQLFARGRERRYSPALWSRTGGHGWRQTQVTLTTHSLERVLLKAERRNGRRGQIAVDDVTLRQGACR